MASPRRLKTLRESPSASDIDHCALRAHRVRVSADFGLCCERERYAAPLLVDAPSPSLYAAVSATGSLCAFEASTRSMRSFVLESCESVRFALTGRVFLPTCTRAVSAKGMQRDFQWIASWRQGTVHACSLPTGLWCTAGLEPHVRALRHCLSRSSVLGCLCVFTGVPWSVVLARCSALHECASRSPGACFCRLALVP